MSRNAINPPAPKPAPQRVQRTEVSTLPGIGADEPRDTEPAEAPVCVCPVRLADFVNYSVPPGCCSVCGLPQ